METIHRTYFGVEWHGGNDIPKIDVPLYALIEEDMAPGTVGEPVVVEATVEYREGGNPPYLWKIKTEDGIDSHSIAGGWSVILWRYVNGA
jgi:hypothetical protein